MTPSEAAVKIHFRALVASRSRTPFQIRVTLADVAALSTSTLLSPLRQLLAEVWGVCNCCGDRDDRIADCAGDIICRRCYHEGRALPYSAEGNGNG